MEQAEFKISRLEEELKLYKEDVELRMAGKMQPTTALPEDATELLNLAQSQLKGGKTREARQAFTLFAQRHAKDSRVDEAIFGIGEAFYREGQFVSAIFEYQKILKDYARSRRVADATLRIGQGFRRLGKCQEAEIFLDSVVEEHKRSSAATEAQAELRQVKAGKCP